MISTLATPARSWPAFAAAVFPGGWAGRRAAPGEVVEGQPVHHQGGQQEDTTATGHCFSPSSLSSRQDVSDDVAVDVGQAVVTAAEAVGESLVVEAHEVQDGRVEVVNMDLLLGRVPAELVGRP